MDTQRLLHRPRAQAGFTVIELAIVLILMGLLILPLLRMAASSVGATRVQQTQAALETARDALIAYAAANNGCLSFAADFEGGLPDTDATGAASAIYFDAGVGKVDTSAGDLPWADLGLTASFLDGDGLRIQSYVAEYFGDTDGNPDNGIKCVGGYRGIEYHTTVNYQGQAGPPEVPIYVYYTVSGAPPGGPRRLYKITGNYPPGNPPPEEALINAFVTDVTGEIDGDVLDVRGGPDVIDPGVQSNEVSKRNVFVLIAPGTNRNANVNRAYVRDSNHTGDKLGGPWPLDATDPPVTIKDVRFSATHNIDTTDWEYASSSVMSMAPLAGYRQWG